MKRNATVRGFTLLEVIITLVVVAVVGAMLFSYFGSSLIQSSTPINRLHTTFSLQQALENITADYRKNYTANLTGLQALVVSEGTSQNNSYGQYSVVENRFIKFSGTSEAAWATGDPQNLLKVTIKNVNGERLTRIFTK